MSTKLLAALFTAVLLLGACGDDDDEAGTASVDTGAASATTDDGGGTSAADTDTGTGDGATDDGASAADTDDGASTGGGATGDAAATDGGELALGASDLGEILTDAEGNVLYLFTPDAQGASTCYDQCEANWPIVSEVATVGEGLDADLLGTTTRDDGDVQATYNGWPLYHFAGDEAPGDTNGQGLNDVWYVVDAEGNAVGADAAEG